MREHSFTESFDRDDAQRSRAAPGRTVATAQLAPRSASAATEATAEERAASSVSSAPPAPSAPPSFEDPFAMHLVSNQLDAGAGGAGGAGGGSTPQPQTFDDDGRGGEHGSTGSPDPSVEARGRERARAELASHAVDWTIKAGPGVPQHLDEATTVPDASSRPCPASVVDDSAAPEWYGAFRSSWDEMQSIYGDAAKRIADFVGAAQNAQALGLSRDNGNAATAGWKAPSGPGSLEKYAGEQGVEGGPSVGEMFQGGKLDGSFHDLERGSSGFSKEDEAAIQASLGARQVALDGVLRANVDFEVLTQNTAKAKLEDMRKLDIVIDKSKLNAEGARGEQKMAELTRERDRMNAKISAAMAVVDGLIAVVKLKNDQARSLSSAGDVAKATSSAASNFVNLEYNGQINEIAAAVGGIKVAIADKDLASALIDKEKAAIDYGGWLRTELTAKATAVRTQFGVYKQAQEKAADVFRAAAVNKVKAAQKAKNGGRAPSKADEAEQKAAGDKAEAVMRALPVIDTVIGIASAGATACREPAYTRESGIGYAMAGSPQELPAKLAQVRGYRAGFQEVAERWKARRAQVAKIVDSHAL